MSVPIRFLISIIFTGNLLVNTLITSLINSPCPIRLRAFIIRTMAASIAYCLSSNTLPVTALFSSLVSFSCSDGTLIRKREERKVWSIRKVSLSASVRFLGSLTSRRTESAKQRDWRVCTADERDGHDGE